jgi:hypothetical protein
VSRAERLLEIIKSRNGVCDSGTIAAKVLTLLLYHHRPLHGESFLFKQQ